MGGPRDLEGLFDVFLEVCNERKSGRSGVPLRERLDQFLGSLGNVPLEGTVAKAPKRINRENLKKVSECVYDTCTVNVVIHTVGTNIRIRRSIYWSGWRI